MNRFLLQLPIFVACFGLGCQEAKKPPHGASQPSQTAVSAPKLAEVGDPDENEREIDGIQVVGSALTDDHVNAIRKLTEEFKPTNPNEYLIRGVTHTGKNAATHVWQTRHYQAYQKLELWDGQWHVVETGGGFGAF